MHRVETITPDAELRQRVWTAIQDNRCEVGSWWQALLIALMPSAPLATLIYFCGPYVSDSALVEALAVLCVLGGGFALFLIRSVSLERKEVRERAALAQAQPTYQRHFLDLGGRCLLLRHEHGTLIVAAHDGGCYLHDISTAADHPWRSLDERVGADEALERYWTWVQTTENSWPLELTMDGEKVKPDVVPDGDTHTEWLFTNFEADGLIDVPFETMAARLRSDEPVQ